MKDGGGAFLADMYALPNGSVTGRVQVTVQDNSPSFGGSGVYDVTDDLLVPQWGDEDAQVVCRELGYASGTARLGNSTYWRHAVSQVECTGAEPTLLSCPALYWPSGRTAPVALATCWGSAAASASSSRVDPSLVVSACVSSVLLVVIALLLWWLVTIWQARAKHPARGHRAATTAAALVALAAAAARSRSNPAARPGKQTVPVAAGAGGRLEGSDVAAVVDVECGGATSTSTDSSGGDSGGSMYQQGRGMLLPNSPSRGAGQVQVLPGAGASGRVSPAARPPGAPRARQHMVSDTAGAAQRAGGAGQGGEAAGSSTPGGLMPSRGGLVEPGTGPSSSRTARSSTASTSTRRSTSSGVEASGSAAAQQRSSSSSAASAFQLTLLPVLSVVGLAACGPGAPSLGRPQPLSSVQLQRPRPPLHSRRQAYHLPPAAPAAAEAAAAGTAAGAAG